MPESSFSQFVRNCVSQFLRASRIGNPRETVVAFAEPDALTLQTHGQPLASIDADVQVEWKPRLQPRVNQTQPRMLEIMVVVQALARDQMQFQQLAPAIAPNLEAAAHFHCAQDADQPFTNAIAPG